MEILEQVQHYLASKLIVKEKVSDEEAASRMIVCLGCKMRSEQENKCMKCGCFLDLKVKSKVNWRPAKNRNEITHCPLGKWGDLEIANEYRRLDGLKLLT